MRIALVGLKTHFADEPPHLVEFHGVVGSGGGYHVLLQHDASQVVGAVLQAQLADLLSRRHPGGLEIGKGVVEDNPAKGQGFEVLNTTGALEPQRLVARLIEPGDEPEESAGLFLQFPHPEHMLDAVLNSFHMAEHHGGGGTHAKGMQVAHDAQPFVRRCLEGRDFLADPVHQNLGPAAGHGIHSRPSGTP